MTISNNKKSNINVKRYSVLSIVLISIEPKLLNDLKSFPNLFKIKTTGISVIKTEDKKILLFFNTEPKKNIMNKIR